MRFTRKGFEAWLRSKPDDERVGQKRREGRCPIACYLRDGLGVETARVKSYTVAHETRSGVASYQKLPRWAEDFIQEVDRKSAPVQVTAARALKVLGKTR